MIKLVLSDGVRYTFPNLEEPGDISQLNGLIHIIQYEDVIVMIKLLPDNPPAPGKPNYDRAKMQLQGYKNILEYERYPSKEIMVSDLTP